MKLVKISLMTMTFVFVFSNFCSAQYLPLSSSSSSSSSSSYPSQSLQGQKILQKNDILNNFKVAVIFSLPERFLRKPGNPAALLNTLKFYTETFPYLVKDFVTVDFSGGSYVCLLMNVVELQNDVFLDSVKYIIEVMKADVNQVNVESDTVLDHSKQSNAIYDYLRSKGAKTKKELFNRYL